jgi:hypothetical protein
MSTEPHLKRYASAAVTEIPLLRSDALPLLNGSPAELFSRITLLSLNRKKISIIFFSAIHIAPTTCTGYRFPSTFAKFLI